MRKKIPLLFEIIIILFLFNHCVIIADMRKSKKKDAKKAYYTNDFVYHYTNYQFEEAYKAINELIYSLNKNKKSKNYYLYLLEKGKIELTLGKYDEAIVSFTEAEKFFVEYESKINISEEISSFFANTLQTTYMAQPYEIISISNYLTLAYFLSGKDDSARVERNRILRKINYFLEHDKAYQYLDNSFSRYIAAILYKLEGQMDDVRIEYEKILQKSKILTETDKESLKDQLYSNEHKKRLVLIIEKSLAPFIESKRVNQGDYIYFVPELNQWENNFDFTIYLNEKNITTPLYLSNLEEVIYKKYLQNRKKHNDLIYRKLLTSTLLHVVETIFMGHNLHQNKKQYLNHEADTRYWSSLSLQTYIQHIPDLSIGEHTIIVESPKKKYIKTLKTIKNQNLYILHFHFPS